MKRKVLGLAIAPLLAAAGFCIFNIAWWLTDKTAQSFSQIVIGYLTLVIMAAVFTYLSAIVIGIPCVAIMERIGFQAIGHYFLLGIILGFVSAVWPFFINRQKIEEFVLIRWVFGWVLASIAYWKFSVKGVGLFSA